MNKLIKKLAELSELPMLDDDGKCKYGDTYFSKEKFAELIVQSCILMIQLKIPRNGFTPENQRSHMHILEIAEEFGINLSTLQKFDIKLLLKENNEN